MALIDDPFMRFLFLIGDYNLKEKFLLLAKVMEAHGPFDIRISWTSNADARGNLQNERESGKFYADPYEKKQTLFQDKVIEIGPNCDYRKVFLGF